MAVLVKPFLMFEGRAEEAMNFYVSLFSDGAVLSLERFAAGENGAEGKVKRGSFIVGGQVVRCFDSAISHGFTFTPAFSLFVDCGSQEELESSFAALAEGGTVLMPTGAYEFSRRFGWVQDRFGVSWQLNLP